MKIQCLSSRWQHLYKEKGTASYPLQYSGLENSIDCRIHGVSKSQTRLSDFHSLKVKLDFLGGASGEETACQCRRQEMWVQSLSWEDSLKKGMTTNFRILAWRIPWTGELGGLQSIELQRLKRLGMHTRKVKLNNASGMLTIGTQWETRYKKHIYSFIFYAGFPGGSDGKESTCNVGELDLTPDLGRAHGKPL